MKNLTWSHLISSVGVLAMLTLALYSPETRSSMNQYSRELANLSSRKISDIESKASPISQESWKHLEPAKQVTQQMMKKLELK
jgi:hypothetical protein